MVVIAAVILTKVCPSLAEPLPVQPRPPLSEPALAFVVALGASSSEEVELQLQGQMEFSKAAVSRVVEASDRLQRRVEELCQRVYSRGWFFLPHRMGVYPHLHLDCIPSMPQAQRQP